MSAAETTGARLAAEHICVNLRGRRIVENVSLTLRAGEFTMLMGPNGAGKTTLMRALAGLIRHDGTIDIDGTALAALAPRRRARALAYLPQGHEFHWPLDVASIVALGREPHADPFTALSDRDRDAIAHAMTETEIEAFAGRPVTTLSGGERARVAIARALATEAPILLADEPIASLDARHQLIVMDLLREVARRGTAVLAIGHDLALAMRYADRVVIMDRGRVIADAAPAEALAPELVARVFGVAVERAATSQGPALILVRPL